MPGEYLIWSSTKHLQLTTKADCHSCGEWGTHIRSPLVSPPPDDRPEGAVPLPISFRVPTVEHLRSGLWLHRTLNTSFIVISITVHSQGQITSPVQGVCHLHPPDLECQHRLSA